MERVLIAEDDVTSRLMLQAILSRWGYEVISTNDGQEAFNTLQQPDAPQLAILDWEMPEMDGTTVCRRLREKERERFLYLILLTARGASDDIVQGLEAGADDYIAKPYNKAELRARVDSGRRMLAMQNEMRERERLQGVLEMAGAVCHELNQPLQSVSGYAELLLMDIGNDDPNHDMLRTIKAGVDRIGKLTHKIMRITKYQAKPYLSGQIVDINQASRSGEIPPSGETSPNE